MEARHLPLRLVALSLLAVAVFLWVALLTWTANDPSPNNATQTGPRNLTGSMGAALADALMQAFGLSAVLLIFPLAAMAWRILFGLPPLRLRLRLFYWALSFLAVPVFFAALPVPRTWPLDVGLGGAFGAILLSAAATLLQGVPQAAASAAILTVSGLCGLWSLFRACDVHPGIFWAAMRGRDVTVRPGYLAPTGEERQRSRMTRWASRLSPKTRQVLAIRKGPREFWMQPQGAKAPPKDESGTMLAEQEVKGRSPFAEWGERQVASAVDHLDVFQDAPRTKQEKVPPADDVRIEPFFGPKRAADPDAVFEDEPSSEAPLLRLTSKVNKVLNGKGGPKRVAPEMPVSEPPPVRQRPVPQPKAPREPVGFDLPQPEPPRPASQTRHQPASPMLPPLSLLSPAPQRREQKPGTPATMQQAARLMDTLNDFGVKGRLTAVHPGPIITLFELEPARGTKLSRVIGLADDIARSLGARAARIAPVTGRDAIGIELPNAKREVVALRGILESAAFADAEAQLPLALGQSISGAPVVADLAKMPHLLIAGTTGSGKSVGINAMILSLLYRMTPDQCKFIMIDPKMLELSAYNGIPHLLAPVVTDPGKAIAALTWVVTEMTARYERMSKLGVRNINSYNAKAAAAALKGEPMRRLVQVGFDPDTGSPIEEEEEFKPDPMPYIVVVIDEMADLMMVAGKDIEYAVQRLSQMARAAGIHVIMATQRPSVDVVTGTIKSNFPSRIGFQVSSKIDSRTIIGEQGAEQLLGAGDMLYREAGGRITRVHGPFVSDGEVESVTQYLRSTGKPSFQTDIFTAGKLDDQIDDDRPRSTRTGRKRQERPVRQREFPL